MQTASVSGLCSHDLPLDKLHQLLKSTFQDKNIITQNPASCLEGKKRWSVTNGMIYQYMDAPGQTPSSRKVPTKL